MVDTGQNNKHTIKTKTVVLAQPSTFIAKIKRYRVSSLRGRFVMSAVILSMVLLPAVYHTKTLVRNAADASATIGRQLDSFQSTINSLQRSLQSAESSIYHYTLLLDEEVREEATFEVEQAKSYTDDLLDHQFTREHPAILSWVNKLNENTLNLGKETQYLLSVVSKVETRYPAAPILLERLQPTSAEFIAALDLAIDETKDMINEPQQKNIMNLFREIRYAWSQQIGAVRVFIANRSGVFGTPELNMARNATNRQIFADQVVSLLKSLQRYEEAGLMGFQQTVSLSRMIKAVKQYEKDFQVAAEIYNSENWRADVPLLNKKIRPLFRETWNNLDSLEAELKSLFRGNLNASLKVSDSLADIILWLMVFVGVAMLFGFLLIEYVIRRPIVEVTKALEAEARGEFYLPHLSAYTTKETDVMVQAFNNMRGQVRSRQSRLELILDNAGEGIITIDSDGFIETFNTAAQQLFGFSAEEALGAYSGHIVKLSESRVHGDFLEFCKHHSPMGTNRINETVLTVRHKDGTTFPMSINVSDLWVEGRQLFIAIVEDISERMALMDNLRTMAEHDSLTGLYNRDYFMTELDRVVENIKRGVRNDLALLYLDLDNFKFVNDTMGHLAGDQLLVEVTDMLSRRTRKSDLLARLGGDEFALLIYGTNEEQVAAAAESYRKLLADYVFKYDGKIVNIGCSIGVTLFGQEPQIKEDILVEADIACHIAKRNGRNRTHIYKSNDKENMAAMSADMGWAARIKNAIAQNQFIITCQPIVDVKTKKVSRQEVLLRLRSDDGTIIHPSGFLPSAERFGLMRAIDKWVIENAIEILGNQLKHKPDTRFSINISAKTLEDATMFEVITQAFKQYSVNPKYVTFEITENTAISTMGSAVEFLNKVRDLGCQTALDDFGVGYSSFAYLKDLPVDLVKIDGSFVRNMQKDALQFAMVRSMNDVAHALGKQTVAEYVENADCLEKLQEIGVDYVQGYFIGKPGVVPFARTKMAQNPHIKLVSG
jgi:diguanylate cyclase (GGDEF)-like protein/PAS domain S-box-containing protein